jgi:hypothetical protein
VGLVGAASCIRFEAYGWTEEFWLRPAHHFTWPGLGWVRPLPGVAMHSLVWVIAAVWIVAAWRSTRRLPCRTWLLAASGGFSYLGLLDVSTYLNHYVLLVASTLMLVLLPDAPRIDRSAVFVMRLLVAAVYTWAAIAKCDLDWLHGRVLQPWLATSRDVPLIGSYLSQRRTAVVLSWAGLVFDAAVVPLLLWRRTRPLAYVAVIAFHVVTAILFPIGVFPWLMIGLTTIFWPPGWPDRWLGTRRTSRRLGRIISRVDVIGMRLAALLVVMVAVLPVRGYLSDVTWSEQGGRFAWRVMATSKVGLAQLVVRPADGSGPAFIVRPERDLSALQVQQMSWQPDLLLQWAHLVRDIESRRLGVPVVVVADVWVSINSGPPRQFVDPAVDLAREEWTPGRPSWVLPEPADR